MSFACSLYGVRALMFVVTVSSLTARSASFFTRPALLLSRRPFVRSITAHQGALTPDELIQMQKKTSNATMSDVDTEQAYLNHQQQVFDEMSNFFAGENATPPEVVPVMRQFAHSILTRCSDQQPTRIMDVGCGTGALFPFYLEAANNLNMTLDITGVDLSPKMANRARQRADSLLSDDSNSSITVVVSDFVELLQQDDDNEYRDSYDAVVANACFGNFLDTDAVLDAMTSCLKVGGTLFITHPLGANFVKKLHKEDPGTVPHLLPTQAFLENMNLPLKVTDWEEVDNNGNPIYFAGAVKVPYQPLPQILRFRGTVDSGYGRGGKKLGFPTANLPESLFANALENISTGVYFGWAVVEGRDGIHKAAVNVGYSPTFEGKENREKIIEAHLILEDPLEDFYNETMRLALIGFLRPEKRFPSFPDLMAAITRDVANAKEALTLEPYASLQADAFLVNSDKEWVGTSGGDDAASWEFEDL